MMMMTALKAKSGCTKKQQKVTTTDNAASYRPLRSARINRLLVPSVKLSTVGGRAFPVAGLTSWNSLPDKVISALSLSTFRQRLKTFVFPASFPDLIIDHL